MKYFVRTVVERVAVKRVDVEFIGAGVVHRAVCSSCAAINEPMVAGRGPLRPAVVAYGAPPTVGLPAACAEQQQALAWRGTSAPHSVQAASAVDMSQA